MSNNSILVIGGEMSYNFKKNIKYKRFMTSLSKSKTYNLGRIDNIHTNIKNLMNHNFRVMLTKYLGGYINYVKIFKKFLNIFEFLAKNNYFITNNKILVLRNGF